MIASGRPIKVEYKRATLAKFRAAARAAWPYETFAYLLGHNCGDHYFIDDVWVPLDVAAHCTKTAVLIQPEWLIGALEDAYEEGLTVVGDIHSHPRPFRHYGGFSREVTPSAGDHAEGWACGICGICAVIQDVSGRLTTRIKFYAPAAAVKEVAK